MGQARKRRLLDPVEYDKWLVVGRCPKCGTPLRPRWKLEPQKFGKVIEGADELLCPSCPRVEK